MASPTRRTVSIAAALALTAGCGSTTLAHEPVDGRQMAGAIEVAIPTTTTTTTTTTTAPPPPPTTAPRPKAPKVSRGVPRSAPTGDVWMRLAMCESGDLKAGTYNPQAISASGTYRGAFQFSKATWASVKDADDPADPIDASFAGQLRNAQRLQARSGWGQWPKCSRTLGLR